MIDPRTTRDETPRTEPQATSSETPHSEQSDQHITAGKHRIHKRVFFFGACAVIAVIAFCIANADSFASVINNIGDVLTPLAIGGVIAYLCNPFLKFYEFVAFRRLKNNGLRRGLSLLCTVLTAIAIIAAIIALIFPQLVASIQQLVNNYKEYLDGLLSIVQGIIDKITANLPPEYQIDVSDRDKLMELIEDMFGSMQNALNQLLITLEKYIMDEAFLDNVWGFFKEVFTALKNVILGIFIAFYILSSKEKRIAQIRKFRAAYFTDKQNARITEFTRLVDRTFGGFIKGVLLDALAVGVVTFILLSIFRVSEYNLLIAAICAITNIIPVFGPFIGAIPSALIVLISNPSKLLVFIILVVVIQQIDGNILCPRIQGNNTGISSLAVLVAITIMGSIGGIVGMVIGVPIFAVIIEMVKRAVETRLVERGVPTDTTHYYPSNAIGNAEEEVYYEHAHLRYVYDHSKFKIHVDNTIAAFSRLFDRLSPKRRKNVAAKKTADTNTTDASATDPLEDIPVPEEPASDEMEDTLPAEDPAVEETPVEVP